MPDVRSARRSHAVLLRAAERRIDAAVLDAISEWLGAVRFRLLHDSLTAAGWPHAPYMIDAALEAAYGEWQNQLENQVLPSISIAFGEAFQSIRRADPKSSYRPQQEYIASVSDRLRIWPAGAFEDIRPELMEAFEAAETVDEMTDRIGRVLNIDAKSRKLRAQINHVEERIAAEDGDLEALYRRRRDLWERHDESLNEWQWKARRIARTESHGAVSAGMLAAAVEEQAAAGVTLYKRWLSTEDHRTRASHRVADGQTVPLDGQFRVGGVLLDHPADAVTIAPHEVINCRCTMLIYDGDELQDEWEDQGDLGTIEPGSVRFGTDDADRADLAIAEVAKREGRATPQVGLRGEDLGQDEPQPWEPIDPTEERERIPLPDVGRASEDQLTSYLSRADETDNRQLWEKAAEEMARRRSDDEQAELDDLAAANAELEAALDSGDPERINRAADRITEVERERAVRRSDPASHPEE
ncbi:MuF-like minor capsid protein [Gordonia phage Lilbeanie]|uniref:MuF-like minor capsid protein n=1 Tax=Gordonia phage Lilbeanie TaxID=2794947 RepID=A0A7T1KS77_9CAUD|nr:head morphogenesis [Gordonia phage Lilbeanie]QPO17093.1 MuF-like minor capsid protein [Gordonia phage Lilbeanie]